MSASIKLMIVSVEDSVAENQLRWFEHVTKTIQCYS